jgi:mono/diheme cytochrome c family protein
MRSNSLSCLAVAACLAGTAALATDGAAAEDDIVNPVLGQAEAIAAGRVIYRTRCYICHLSNGGRGPDLFASKLSDNQFLETAINGRGTMPAFGTLMTPDDVWTVHAYVKSTDHYE